MPTRTSVTLALLALTIAACRSSSSAAIAEARADESHTSASPSGVAVVELFTSEGCSSCPSADLLLADLERQHGTVYGLEFHVDYWNGLGWPDRFSSPDWTARQRAYARSFGTSSLYTPQMIVAGTDGFDGSDRGRAETDIARSIAKPAPVRLLLHARNAAPEAIAVDFDAPGAPADSAVSVAIVQRDATTDVGAGENAGRTLRHTNIVRAFATARPGAVTLTLRVPGALRRSDGEIVAFVQRDSAERGRPILGAARAPLP